MSPGHSAAISLPLREVGRPSLTATARTAATCATFDGMFSHVPKPSCSARAGADRVAPLGDEPVDGVEARAAAANRGRTRGVELVERAERAGHDDEPAPGPEAGREGAQHARGGEVVRLRHGGSQPSSAGSGSRGSSAACRVGEDDVDLSQFGSQRPDGPAVAQASTRPSTRAPALGTAAAAARTRSGSRPVSRMRSPGFMRAASASTSARPRPWLAPVTRAVRVDVIKQRYV